MIRQVTITEFGPDGLCFSILEAPGSMCVMTVPGLTPEPKPEPSFVRRKSPRLVVAGNFSEYDLWREKWGFEDGSDSLYYSPGCSYLGFPDLRLIFTGSHMSRRDLPEIHRFLDGFRSSGKRLVIDYQD
jgi:hypothetical protein